MSQSKPETTASSDAQFKQRYYVPEYGITVEATSVEDAVKKAAEQTKKAASKQES